MIVHKRKNDYCIVYYDIAYGRLRNEWHDKEVIQENLQEEKDAERKKAAEESSEEYKASFLGGDSSAIQACQVYYGERQEEIDMSEARGKYLVQMLSGFLENPDYSFMYKRNA